MKLKDLAGQSVLSGLSFFSTLDGRQGIRIRLCQTVYEFTETHTGCADPVVTTAAVDVAFFPVDVLVNYWTGGGHGFLQIRNLETSNHIMSVGNQEGEDGDSVPHFFYDFSPWALVQLGHSQ